MKSKLSWIPFILLLPAAFFLKLSQSLIPEGIFGLNVLQQEYLYLGCVALMFLLALLLCLLDRKIAPYYVLHRNIAAGLIALVSALLLAADGAGFWIRTFSAGEKSTLAIIGAILSLINAIVFVLLGLGHMSRRDEERKLSLVYALPAVMFAVRLILSFVSFTTVSIRLADVAKLVCYVFVLMFFFYYAVVLSQTKTKNALKMCLAFGFPAVTALLPYGIYRLFFAFDTQVILNNLEPAELLLLGFYILSLLIEITAFAVKRENQEAIVDTVNPAELSDKKVEDFFANIIAEDKSDSSEETEIPANTDTEGFLYQETKNTQDDTESEKMMQSEVDGYLTEVYDEETMKNEDESSQKTYESQMDDIDKLILEITEKSE
ncbi:hypothetical protein [Ruminococcus sp.]|uniref:hypothetical protein n=1 Tax=Ruminococcus sp. TaxID=41978 RepID=UPI00388F3A58